MCDYSLTMFASRPAAAGDKLITKRFGGGSTGLVDAEESNVAVCLLPGTELAFDKPVKTYNQEAESFTTGKFVQLHKDTPHCHHDAVEFLGGEVMMLGALPAGLGVHVLQLPAEPKTEAEAQEQKRVEYAG